MSLRTKLSKLASLLPILLGCATRERAPLGASGADRPSGTAPVASVGARSGAAPFESRGGMWMPEQIPAHADTLRRLGLKIDPAALSDPLSSVLGAVVNLGGCSASFVSKRGLIITNHHCAVGALQYNTTPSENLLRDGFVASPDQPERWAGPTLHLFVTRALRDVSEAVQRAVGSATDDLQRKRALDAFEKRTVTACEKGSAAKRCELRSFYGGLRHYVIEKMELRDVRLVYAPPEGIGNYGGEVDNWRWPRHTGDFAFLRAYVGKDGQPSEYAAENVPYEPPHHLALATKPLRENDLVLVAGYPGRTSLLAPADAVEETVNWLYPRRLGMFDAYIAAIESAAKTDADAGIKGTPWLRAFNNFRTKHLGELEGFQRGGLLAKKRADEAQLRAFIAADPAREARYGGALDGLAATHADRRRTREADTALETEILMPRLLYAATRIVRLAEERRKPDAERDPEYQERKVPDITDELVGLDKRSNPALDRAILTLALRRVLATPEAERTPALEVIAGKKPTEASIERAVEKLYAGTRLADVKYRLRLIDPARAAEVTNSGDTMIRAAHALRPVMRDAEDRGDRFYGRMLRFLPDYVAALLEWKNGNVAPDANGTLRITYGVVRPPQGLRSEPFTRLTDVARKNQGTPPFDAPQPLLEAVAARRLGPYVAPELGDVPVDFLSNVHITNGNSGSATLDAEGKLTGLAFDGTYDSVASDWFFLPETRCIHVDVRYILWVLHAVSRDEALLRELGVTARVPTR